MKRYFRSVLGPEFEHRFRVLIIKLYFTTIMYPFKFCLWYYNQSKDFQCLALLKICLNGLKTTYYTKKSSLEQNCKVLKIQNLLCRKSISYYIIFYLGNRPSSIWYWLRRPIIL